MIPSRHLTDSTILRLATSCGYTVCSLKYDNKMSPNLPSSQLHREIPSEHRPEQRPQQASIQQFLFPYPFKNFHAASRLSTLLYTYDESAGSASRLFCLGVIYGNTAHFWHKHCATWPEDRQ